jgi:hypothetical protein
MRKLIILCGLIAFAAPSAANANGILDLLLHHPHHCDLHDLHHCI